MLTVNSVSGGKTSAMMAIKYPADINLFAVVLTRSKHAVPQDKGILREAVKRIPWFEGSLELDLTLKAMLDIEQLYGIPITWTASEYTMDDIITNSTLIPGMRSHQLKLPNARSRVCTQYLKVAPIFEYCFLEEPVLMNIGFRKDESHRVEKWACKDDVYRFAYCCELKTKRHRWVNRVWRVVDFPLYRDGVDKTQVEAFWSDSPIKFPTVSNCDFCFHHRPGQQKEQAQLYPDRALTWLDWEDSAKASFGRLPLRAILGKDLDSEDSEGYNPCHCSD